MAAVLLWCRQAGKRASARARSGSFLPPHLKAELGPVKVVLKLTSLKTVALKVEEAAALKAEEAAAAGCCCCDIEDFPARTSF